MGKLFPLFSSKTKSKDAKPQGLTLLAPPTPVAPAATALPVSAPISAPSPDFQFTLALMKQLFPGVPPARHSDLSEIAAEVNTHLEFYKLDGHIGFTQYTQHHLPLRQLG